MAEEVVVIEKVIAKEPLTKEMIDAGANVLLHLNKANLDVRGLCGSTGWNRILGVSFPPSPK